MYYCIIKIYVLLLTSTFVVEMTVLVEVKSNCTRPLLPRQRLPKFHLALGDPVHKYEGEACFELLTMPFFGRSKKKEAKGSNEKNKKLSVAERRARRKEQRKSKKKSLYRIEEQSSIESLNEETDDNDVVELISDDEVMNEDPFDSPKKLNASSSLVMTHNTSRDDTIEIANSDDVLELSMDENTLSPEKAKDFFLVSNTSFETHVDQEGKHHFSAALKDAA